MCDLNHHTADFGFIVEVPEIRAFFSRFGDHLPAELTERLATLERDLARVAV